MSSSPELSTDDLRTKVYLESNRVKGPHTGAPRRAFIAELRDLSRDDLIKRYNELFPPMEEVPRTLGYNPHENREAWETARRTHGPKSLALHPRGAFAQLFGQCSKCHIQVTVDLRKNGQPNGLIFDFSDKKWERISYSVFKHIGCGGKLQKFRDSIPPGYGIYEPFQKPTGRR